MENAPKPIIDISEVPSKSRLRIEVDGEEKIVKMLFKLERSKTNPENDKITVDGKLYPVDDVKILEILPWEEN